jgi:hypothetical protein
MLKGLNDFLDKHEGREVGSSTKAIMKERKRQGYDKSTPRSKALKGERMPNGEKSHHLDLSKIKGKKFGVGTFHK